ncbi:MAG: gamma-glutamyltransferase [Chloroflexi bacterium]|nr:gamma-glutamyltransferase [Chloroflexota bacterium]
MSVEWPLAKTFPTGRRGLVAAKQPLAAGAGVEILRRGGNAVDAAIATSLASGVAEPSMSGLGGGGLALLQLADGAPLALDFGMRAPRSAGPNMYEVIPGTVDRELFGWPRTRGDANVLGPSSIALPGLVAGLHRLWQLGGTLPWRELAAPAIRLAADGFAVDWLTSLRILHGQDLLSRFPASRAIFLSRGRPPHPDMGLGAEVLRQPDLSRTLQAVADDPTALAHGRIGEAIAQAAGGRFTPEELRSHTALEAEPISIGFDRLDVHLVPWATGGPSVLEWLGILRELDPPADQAHPRFWWAVVRAGQVAMRDRLRLLGDPDFVPFPSHLLDPAYHRRMAEAIAAQAFAPVPTPPDGGSTSHLAVADSRGTTVTITQTLLSGWGSGVVAGGTGVCLNNGMMWFDPEPGRPNSVAGGKLALANMCPVLVTRDGAPLLAYGASGGRKILGAVVQILARVALLGQSLDEAMAAPRVDLAVDGVVADARLGPALIPDLSRLLGQPVLVKDPSLAAPYWASPVGLVRLEDGSWTGGGDPYSMACVLAA